MALTDQEVHQTIADGLIPSWRAGFAEGLKTAIEAIVGSLDNLEEHRTDQIDAYAQALVAGLQQAIEQIASEGPIPTTPGEGE